MEIAGTITGIAALALVIVWNVVQAKRLDGLQKRIEALESK